MSMVQTTTAREVVMRCVLLTACALLALNSTAAGQAGMLRISGAVQHPVTLSRDEIASLPHQTVTASAHDQSGRYDGVPLIDLLKRAGVSRAASAAMFWAVEGPSEPLLDPC